MACVAGGIDAPDAGEYCLLHLRSWHVMLFPRRQRAHCPSLALSPSSGASCRAGAGAEISPAENCMACHACRPQAGGSGAWRSLARHVICVACSWQDNRHLMDASLVRHVILLLSSSTPRSATRPRWRWRGMSWGDGGSASSDAGKKLVVHCRF